MNNKIMVMRLTLTSFTSHTKIKCTTSFLNLHTNYISTLNAQHLIKSMLVPVRPNCPLVNGVRPLVNSHLKINHMQTWFLWTNGCCRKNSRSWLTHSHVFFQNVSKIAYGHDPVHQQVWTCSCTSVIYKSFLSIHTQAYACSSAEEYRL